MGERSFMYSNALMYKLALNWAHGRNLNRRYAYISEKIGPNRSVLEPACGPALLPDYLHASCTYTGFDINEYFAEHARKRGLKVEVADALEQSAYVPSDAVVLCDALHHIGQEQEKTLIINSLKAAKKQLIICEPFKDSSPGLWERVLGRSFFIACSNYVERDGNNLVRVETFRTKEELKGLMMNCFGVLLPEATKEIKCIGNDLIVTYNL